MNIPPLQPVSVFTGKLKGSERHVTDSVLIRNTREPIRLFIPFKSESQCPTTSNLSALEVPPEVEPRRHAARSPSRWDFKRELTHTPKGLVTPAAGGRMQTGSAAGFVDLFLQLFLPFPSCVFSCGRCILLRAPAAALTSVTHTRLQAQTNVCLPYKDTFTCPFLLPVSPSTAGSLSNSGINAIDSSLRPRRPL